MSLYRILCVIPVFALAVPSLASAEPVYFNQNIFCKSASDTSSVKITFNPNEFPGLGRPGGIHVEINTGVGSLAALAVNLGLSKSGFNQTIRRDGKHGQVGNWIEQDLQSDP